MAEVQRCDICGQETCVVFSTAPIHPLYCMCCYDEQIANPEDEEDEEEQS